MILRSNNCRHSSRIAGAFTLVELLVVIAIIGVLVSLLLPAVQSAREAARRAQCTNQIRQIGLAMHNYESALHHFPEGTKTQLESPCRAGFQFGQLKSGASPSCSNGPGWTILILPYIEQQALYDQFDLDQPFNYLYDLCASSVNAQLQMTPLRILQCPSDPIAQPGTLYNNYHVCTGGGDWTIPNLTNPELGFECASQVLRLTFTNGITYYDSQTKTGQITDGLSNTVMVGESRLHYHRGSYPGGQEDRYSGWSSTFDVHPAFGVPINAGATSRPINGTVSIADESQWNDPGIRASEFGSYHPGIAHFVFADGSSRQLSEDIDLELYWSLGRKDDGLPVGEVD